MRALVIGRSGQMAQALKVAGTDAVHCLGRPDIDLSDATGTQACIAKAEADIVINTAAYTAVDKAESEAGRAFAVNAEGPENLAAACREKGVPLIHFSTDCVFDGMKAAPYQPEDECRPLGTYGASKLAGEVAVAEAMREFIILRVSWIFSAYAGNFVKTMLSLAARRDEVTVVSDQYGCPTFAPALAGAVLQIARTALKPSFDQWGIYHIAGHGETDRASMAQDIFALSRDLGGPYADVRPVLTAEYPTPAQRPLNARLAMDRTTDIFGVTLPAWREGLAETVPQFIRERAAS